MTRLIYLSNARLPTEKANGYQIIKTCQAFAGHAEVLLLYPKRRQTTSLKDKSIWEYYGVNSNFTSKSLPTLDLEKYLPHHWFYLQAISHTLATLLYTFQWWNHPDTIFFGRDLFSIVILLVLRPFIKAKLVFEAHVFPSKTKPYLFSLLKRLDYLVVITHQLQRLFIEAGFPSEKLIVAPDAVDLVQFSLNEDRVQCRKKLSLPPNRPIVGYIGRFRTMEMEKGIPELIQAMGYLQQWQPDNLPLLLCVGGPLEYVPQYEQIAKLHKLPHNMYCFIDRVPNLEVPYWMRACDVVTIPWAWNEFSAYYTSPMKLFEYMASGTPIVASNLPSLQEVLTHEKNAILVEPGSAISLANGLHRILSNSTEAREFAKQAMNDVNNYTWEKRAIHILSSIIT